MRNEYDFSNSRRNPYVTRLRLRRLFGIAIVLAVVWVGTCDACTTRSSAARAAFQRAHPCPANGATRGSCPGWIIDHVKPRCLGGVDAPSNMQWQTVADAAAKDRIEWAQCRKKRST